MPNTRRTNALDDTQAALRMLLAELEELAPAAPPLVGSWSTMRERDEHVQRVAARLSDSSGAAA